MQSDTRLISNTRATTQKQNVHRLEPVQENRTPPGRIRPGSGRVYDCREPARPTMAQGNPNVCSFVQFKNRHLLLSVPRRTPAPASLLQRQFLYGTWSPLSTPLPPPTKLGGDMTPTTTDQRATKTDRGRTNSHCSCISPRKRARATTAD